MRQKTDNTKKGARKQSPRKSAKSKFSPNGIRVGKRAVLELGQAAGAGEQLGRVQDFRNI